jgi:hypothetical protein
MSTDIERATREARKQRFEQAAKSPAKMAERLWHEDFHPVAIHPGQKRPIGLEWGMDKPGLNELRRKFRDNQGAGVGICLGPGKFQGCLWLIDLEGDGPQAEDSLAKLFDGEVVETLGHRSARGRHWFFFAPDDILDKLAAAGGVEGSGLKSGVYKLDEYPDLEIRVGGCKPDGTVKQVQSVVPPTVGDDGKPREWNGCFEVAELPAAAIRNLERIAAAKAAAKAAVASNGHANGHVNGHTDAWKLKAPVTTTKDLESAYVASAFEGELKAVESAPAGERNNTLNVAALKVGQLVGGGFIPESEAAAKLTEAGLRAGLGDAEVKATVRSGMEAGKKQPRVLPELGRNGKAPAAPAATTTVPAEPEPDLDDIEIVDRWPALDSNVFYGVAGRIAVLADPHTESAMVATLIQFLAAFGCMIDRSAYFLIGATRHYMKIYPVLVGGTGVGRKGTSWDIVRWLLSLIDPGWESDRIQSGLVSGEGLAHHVRDERREVQEVRDRKSGKVETLDVLVDAGVKDKRLLVVETEMSRMLKAASRDSNTLSDVIRQAWETDRLRTMGKQNPTKATGAHVSIIAHTNPADVKKYLTDTDAANGTANRFLWLLTRRSKSLPDGGEIFSVDWNPVVDEIRAAAEKIRARGMFRITRDPAANAVWRKLYPKLTEDRGPNGYYLDRAAPYVLRLASLYAILDGEAVIKVEHLTAAVCLWDYCEESAKLIFGIKRDANEAKLLDALEKAPGGLTRKEINVEVFQKHLKASALAALLGGMLTRGVIRRQLDSSTGGRPAERWFKGKGEGLS